MEIYLHTKPTAWYQRDKNLVEALGEQGAAQFLKENSEENLDRQISFLKTKETNFYGRFFTNCSTYEDFIKRFRKLFNNSPQDIEVLRNFTSANVRKILTNTYGTHWVGASNDSSVNLNIKVKNPEPVEIKLKDKKIKGIGEINLSGNSIKINVGVNDEGIKKLKAYFNIVFKTQFHTTSANPKAITEFIANLANEGLQELDDIIEVQGGKEHLQNTFKTLQKTQLVLGTADQSTPFDFKKEDIDSAIASGSDVQIKQALKNIREFIYLKMGIANGSQELKTAYNQTWKNTIEGDLYKSAFFLKGGNLNYLAGAFGEYQTAMLFNYLACKCPDLKEGVKAIISTTIFEQQKKTDITLFEDIGVQVKNYTMFTPEKFSRTMPTTISPKQFLDKLQHENLIEENAAISLESFIANYGFNESFRQIDGMKSMEKALEKTFSTYYAEMYHLAVEDSLSGGSKSLNDTVLFYSIGGKVILPASVILEAAKNKDGFRNNFIISWPTAKDEAYFYSRSNKVPAKKYWRRLHGPYKEGDASIWQRQPVQDTKINNLMNNISMQSGFKVSSNFINLSKYKIFD